MFVAIISDTYSVLEDSLKKNSLSLSVGVLHLRRVGCDAFKMVLMVMRGGQEQSLNEALYCVTDASVTRRSKAPF